MSSSLLALFHLCLVSVLFSALSILKRGGGGKYKGKGLAGSHGGPEVMASGKYENLRLQGSFILTVSIHAMIHIRPTHTNVESWNGRKWIWVVASIRARGIAVKSSEVKDGV